MANPFTDGEIEALIGAWAAEEIGLVEQRLFRFGVSGVIAAATADTTRGSVLLENSDGRRLVVGAPADVVAQIEELTTRGIARYHLASSTVSGSVAVLWAWSRAGSRGFRLTAVSDVDTAGSTP